MPQYDDSAESDLFILSGAEDLMLALVQSKGEWVYDAVASSSIYRKQYAIRRYRPRVEGLFARIERRMNLSDPWDTFLRSISKDNITNWYGKTAERRIAGRADASRIFNWLYPFWAQSVVVSLSLKAVEFFTEMSKLVQINLYDKPDKSSPAQPDTLVPNHLRRNLVTGSLGNIKPLPEAVTDATHPPLTVYFDNNSMDGLMAGHYLGEVNISPYHANHAPNGTRLLRR